MNKKFFGPPGLTRSRDECNCLYQGALKDEIFGIWYDLGALFTVVLGFDYPINPLYLFLIHINIFSSYFNHNGKCMLVSESFHIFFLHYLNILQTWLSITSPVSKGIFQNPFCQSMDRNCEILDYFFPLSLA